MTSLQEAGDWLAKMGNAVLKELQTLDSDTARSQQTGRIYGEQAFRYLLSVERRRSGRSGRQLGLLLVRKVDSASQFANREEDLAGRLFAELSACLRETDVLGWYEQGRVVGALMVDGTEELAADEPGVAERVRKALESRLPDHVARRLSVSLSSLQAT